MNNKLNVLYFNIFLMFLGISIVIPVLPTILHDLDLNGSDLGMLVAVFAMFQMIASPFGGRFADKFGKNYYHYRPAVILHFRIYFRDG